MVVVNVLLTFFMLMAYASNVLMELIIILDLFNVKAYVVLIQFIILIDVIASKAIT